MTISEQMYEQGYVIIPQVIDGDEIEAIKACYRTIAARSGLTTLLPTDILKYPSIFNVLLKESVVRAIRHVFGRDFCLFPNFTIRESVYIPWHNDAYFLPEAIVDPQIPLQFMQCAVYLQDNDMHSGGGITLIPSSHRLSQRTIRAMLETPEKYEQCVMSKSGDLVLWDNRVTHRSSFADKTPDSTKLALQWTVSASEKHNGDYLNYLHARSQQKLHVSDFLKESPRLYFADMLNIQFPSSFHPDALQRMEQQNIRFTGL